ncbi:ribonuclease HII [Neptunicoccus sediminis]|uniref:ribonuclease HII n=1 Tax=Neptunicoccus sediminis TaxID=1892596 RepID=UPI0008461D8C|nr:ribonuclease HII [Neptunicoccus sediminis]
MIDITIEPERRRSLGVNRIAGVDEVGRGPWAGPVTACAVVLDPRHIPEGLNDSKKLTAKRREILFDQIMAQADVSVFHVDVEEIDRINILQASLLAMRRAIEGLAQPTDFALIDGNKVPQGLACPSETLVKGDGRCLSIAAASIVAKVTRDRMMVALSQQFPGYGWETNAGYGTKAHIAGLETLGVTQHHRRSFKPIHNMLWSEDCPKNV